MTLEPEDWGRRLDFVRDVLDGVLLATERGRRYSETELIRKALILLEQYIKERNQPVG
jgi:hypothetical protein